MNQKLRASYITAHDARRLTAPAVLIRRTSVIQGNVRRAPNRRTVGEIKLDAEVRAEPLMLAVLRRPAIELPLPPYETRTAAIGQVVKRGEHPGVEPEVAELLVMTTRLSHTGPTEIMAHLHVALITISTWR